MCLRLSQIIKTLIVKTTSMVYWWAPGDSKPHPWCIGEPQVIQNKDYEIGICCFPTRHAALRMKSNEWLARNQNNVSEWSYMPHAGLFQWTSTYKSNSVSWSSTKRTSSSFHQNLTCSRRDIVEKSFMLCFYLTFMCSELWDWESVS
jgi:hypothetical protein